jgi:hypothetical protein
MKQIIKTIYRLYNLKIIIVFITLFFVIHIPFLQRIPDPFQLIKIETPQSFLLRLLSIVIGFSSFILTTFLVIYNLFSKRLRRNSFDYILNNPWINRIFSFFCGSLIFLLLAIFSISSATNNTITTLLYFSTIITFGNLLLQFPLIILSIQHSNSYNSIKKIINNINETDIQELYNPKYEADNIYLIEHLEKNKIILLKDIGVSAIKENDWGIPQTILNGLLGKLIEKADLLPNDAEELDANLYSYNFVSRHFQKAALESADEITIKTALSNLFDIHTFFIKRKVINLRSNHVDENLHDLVRNIFNDSAYYNLQPFIITNLIELIDKYIESIDFTDSELPTRDYIRSQKNFDFKSRTDEIRNYWHYITRDLPSLFFIALSHAIETKNKNAYSRINWRMQSLFDKISYAKNLTESQEHELFDEYCFQAEKVVNLAIEQGIYRDIEIFSPIQIEIWISQGKAYATYALYNIGQLLKKLNSLNKLNETLIDDYFTIGRLIYHREINNTKKVSTFKTIIKNGREMVHLSTTQTSVKNEIKNQFNWLYEMLSDGDEFAEIKSELSTELSS